MFLFLNINRVTSNTGILGTEIREYYLGEKFVTFYLEILKSCQRFKMIFLSRLCISGSFVFTLMHI